MVPFFRNLKILFRKGVRPLLVKIGGRTNQKRLYKNYLLFLRSSEDKEGLERVKDKSFPYRPKMSIVVPVYKPRGKWLRLCLESVLRQIYDNWELCIAEGSGPKSRVREILEEYSRRDSRVKVKYLKENKGIVGNTNEALELATGEWIGMLDHDDELSPDALYEVVKTLNENSHVDFIYTDEDKIIGRGKRFDPHFKPDWSPDTFRSYNYINHFAVIRRALIDEVGGFRDGFEGSQDYDLFLRVVERTQKIFHIPKVLYHWRYHSVSVSGNPKAKRYACQNAKKALKEHMERVGLNGEVYDGLGIGCYRIKYHIEESPRVSIIIQNGDDVKLTKRCIQSIVNRSSYKNYGIVLVTRHRVDENTLMDDKGLRNQMEIKILDAGFHDAPSAINHHIASQVDSKYMIFLDNDTEIISKDWIESMLEFAQRKDVGAVGVLLYYPDETIQHAGIIMSMVGFAGYAHRRLPRGSPGYFNRARIIQNLSAISSACMMTKKNIFEEVGFFEKNFHPSLSGLDFCLKIRQKGYLIVYTPYAQLYHHESRDQREFGNLDRERFDGEIESFQKKWRDVLSRTDPYYNPNFTKEKTFKFI